jgi:hypothetical protein
MAGILHGRIDLCQDWRQLPSGEQFNQVARLLRYLTTDGIEVGITTAGGLHLSVQGVDIELESIAEDLPENDTFITNLIQNQTFTTNLAQNNTFVTTIAQNSTFVSQLIQNHTFTTSLAQDNTFIQQLTQNNNFVSKLFENQQFVNNLRNLLGGGGSFRLTYDPATDSVTCSGGQIVAGTHSVTIPATTYPGGSWNLYAVVTYSGGSWNLGLSQTLPAAPNAWTELIGTCSGSAGNRYISQAWTGEGSIRVTDRWVD